MSSLNFILSSAEHEKSFITSGPDVCGRIMAFSLDIGDEEINFILCAVKKSPLFSC